MEKKNGTGRSPSVFILSLPVLCSLSLKSTIMYALCFKADNHQTSIFQQTNPYHTNKPQSKHHTKESRNPINGRDLAQHHQAHRPMLAEGNLIQLHLSYLPSLACEEAPNHFPTPNRPLGFHTMEPYLHKNKNKNQKKVM